MVEERYQRALCAVSVVVVCKDRVLALRRSKFKDFAPGQWEVVSGRVFEGETLLDAAQRELLEETGCLDSVDPFPINAYLALRGGETMLVVLFRVRVSSETQIELSQEHDRYQWLSAGEFHECCLFKELVVSVDLALKV